MSRRSGVRTIYFIGCRAEGRKFVGIYQGEKSSGDEGVAGDKAVGLQEALRNAPVCVLGGRIAKKR